MSGICRQVARNYVHLNTIRGIIMILIMWDEHVVAVVGGGVAAYIMLVHRLTTPVRHLFVYHVGTILLGINIFVLIARGPCVAAFDICDSCLNMVVQSIQFIYCLYRFETTTGQPSLDGKVQHTIGP